VATVLTQDLWIVDLTRCIQAPLTSLGANPADEQSIVQDALSRSPQATEPVRVHLSPAATVHDPAWSPDGTRIAFTLYLQRSASSPDWGPYLAVVAAPR